MIPWWWWWHQLVEAELSSWSWHLGKFQRLRHSSDWCVVRMLVVVVTPWWQEMVEGRRKWSLVACQVAEIRGNVAKQKLPQLEGPRRSKGSLFQAGGKRIIGLSGGKGERRGKYDTGGAVVYYLRKGRQKQKTWEGFETTSSQQLFAQSEALGLGAAHSYVCTLSLPL